MEGGGGGQERAGGMEGQQPLEIREEGPEQEQGEERAKDAQAPGCSLGVGQVEQDGEEGDVTDDLSALAEAHRGEGHTECHTRLREQGVLIRNCGNYHGLGEGWYRAAVRTEEENRQLLAAMERVMR